MKVLADETWFWMLVEHDGSLLFTVLCGGVAMYSVDFALSESERTSYEREGRPFLARLARQVSADPAPFRERRISDFDKLPGLHEAVAAWRAGNSGAP